MVEEPGLCDTVGLGSLGWHQEPLLGCPAEQARSKVAQEKRNAMGRFAAALCSPFGRAQPEEAASAPGQGTAAAEAAA